MTGEALTPALLILAIIGIVTLVAAREVCMRIIGHVQKSKRQKLINLWRTK